MPITDIDAHQALALPQSAADQSLSPASAVLLTFPDTDLVYAGINKHHAGHKKTRQKPGCWKLNC
jgi:hypothetical protein